MPVTYEQQPTESGCKDLWLQVPAWGVMSLCQQWAVPDDGSGVVCGFFAAMGMFWQ
jgi:hypothetical protein